MRPLQSESGGIGFRVLGFGSGIKGGQFVDCPARTDASCAVCSLHCGDTVHKILPSAHAL